MDVADELLAIIVSPKSAMGSHSILVNEYLLCSLKIVQTDRLEDRRTDGTAAHELMTFLRRLVPELV